MTLPCTLGSQYSILDLLVQETLKLALPLQSGLSCTHDINEKELEETFAFTDTLLSLMATFLKRVSFLKGSSSLGL